MEFVVSPDDPDVIETAIPLGIFAKYLFERSVEYADTLRLLSSHDKPPLRPAGFLFAHALEVGLKAFLAASGVSKKTLERTLGHDLTRIMDWAVWLDLPEVDNLRAFVNHMHEMNRDFDLRYPSEYNLLIPRPVDCLPIIEGLLAAIEPLVEMEAIDAQLHFAADTRHLTGKRIVFKG